MIMKRKPALDDRRIFTLIVQELLPYSRITRTSIRMKAIKERLNKGTTYVARTAAGQCVGFILLRKVEQDYWIDMLAIDGKWQGRQLGTRLLFAAERTIKRRKGTPSSVRLFVDRSNARALQFYMRHQYKTIGYERQADCYVLEKRLSTAGSPSGSS